MFNRIRNYSLKPMSREMFIKRIAIIELIEILGTIYYYADKANLRKLMVSLSKAGNLYFFGSLILGAIVVLLLLEFNYVLRRAKDAGISWVAVLIVMFFWKYSMWIKGISLVVLCIVGSKKVYAPYSADTPQNPVNSEITIADRQDISVSDFAEGTSEKKSQSETKETFIKSKIVV